MVEDLAKSGDGRTSLKTGLLLVSASLVVAIVLGWGLWTLFGDDDELRRLVWLQRQRVFGPEPVGIWQEDPRFGWRHKPGAEGRQREVPDYDVRYRIDGDGHRRIPEAPEPGVSSVLFLGGSVTFGHGVEDAEPYPAVLQRRWPGVRVVNAATNAWGTTQALLALEEALTRDAPWAGVVYGFIGHHIRRNHLSLEWLTLLDESRGRRNPYFELEGNELKFQGLAGPEDGIPQSPKQAQREIHLTLALVREMQRLSQERDLPFIFLHLPDGSTREFSDLFEAELGPSYVDLRPGLDFQPLHFKHDYHYTAEGHRRVAAAAHRPLAARIPALARRVENIVMITLDTLRADRLGCYGYARPTSPNIDRLARDAYVFDHAVAQSAVTPVSHASILTGLNPYRHGLRSLHGGEGYALDEQQRPLAERLLDHGYSTAGFVSAFPATRRYGLHQGFEIWDQDFDSADGSSLITETGIVNTGRAQRRADATTDRALAWLRSRDADRPFFLWAHYFDVHDTEILPPEEVRRRFPSPTDRREDLLRATYDAELAFIDEQIGRLLTELAEQSLSENTIVAMVSDHGEGLGDHDWWGHGILYQEQVRVPLVLSVPGLKGGRIQPLVRTVDLLPTLLELLQLGPVETAELDGRSLVPLLHGTEDQPRLAYSESLNDLSAYYDSPMQNESLYAVNDGRWKLIQHREEGRAKSVELFDLAVDPRELQNLTSDRPDQVARLLKHLKALSPFAEPQEIEPIDSEAREKLRALGYIN